MNDTDREALTALLTEQTDLHPLSVAVVVNVIGHSTNRAAVLRALGLTEEREQKYRFGGKTMWPMEPVEGEFERRWVTEWEDVTDE